MHFRTALYFILFSSMLAGSMAKAQVTLDPCISNTAFRIVVLGSSTAAGAGPSHPDSAWVNKYRKSLQLIHPQSEVINLAVGGFTTYRIMPDGFITPPNRPAVDSLKNITMALSLQPDAIIINLPSNDRQWPKEEQLSNFDSLYSHSWNQGVPLFICTTQPIIPLSAASYQKAVRDSILSRYSPYAIEFFSPLADTNNTLLSVYAADAVHLNDSGHRVLHTQVMTKDILQMIHQVPTGYDLAVKRIIHFTGGCTQPQSVVGVEVANLGDSLFSGNILKLTVNGQGQTYTLNDTLSTCSGDTLFFVSAFPNDTVYHLEAEVILTGDQDSSNNYAEEFITVQQTPAITWMNDTVCKGDTTQFSAVLLEGDTLLWYVHPSDSLPLDSVMPFTFSQDTALYLRGATGPFYYEGDLSTTANKNIDFNGNMFDLVSSEDLRMLSMDIRSAQSGWVPVTVYTRTGSYEGHENQPNDWTLWTMDTIWAQNAEDWISINMKSLQLTDGDTTGVYVHMTNSGDQLSYLSAGSTSTYATVERMS